MVTGPAPSGSRVARRWASRAVWFVAGWASVAVGGVGIVVPGLPTTVFFVIAAGCFARCSPRFEQWVLDLPKIGPMVRDHRAGLGMPRRTKLVAIGMMWAAIAVSAFVLWEALHLVAVVVAAGLVGAAYVWWRVPTREHVLAARAS